MLHIEWLTHRVEVAEAEAANLRADRRRGPEKIPFGVQNDNWLQLVDELRRGGELWAFRSPDKTWAAMCGRAGFAVVKNGAVVAIQVTMMN